MLLLITIIWHTHWFARMLLSIKSLRPNISDQLNLSYIIYIYSNKLTCNKKLNVLVQISINFKL